MTGRGGGRLFTVNEFFTMMSRAQLTSALDPKGRDINQDCGYEDNISLQTYLELDRREGIASRIIDVLPEESWSTEPDIYEIKDNRYTSYEKAYAALTEEHNLLSYFHRIDRESGVGSYGLMFFGLDDGEDLFKPVRGVGLNGKTDGKPQGFNLNYIRIYNQGHCRILKWDTDIESVRYGLPLMYAIKMGDMSVSQNADAAAPPTKETQVHWTRVLHVADNCKSSEVIGTPRLERVYNRVMDIRKILSGSAEMFWKGAFPGYSFETDPALGGDVELDKESMRKEFEEYANGLKRYLALKGMTTKSLSPQVASPHEHFMAQINTIAISLGVPTRVFLGSEEAKMAATQDSKTWNRRLGLRQRRHINPNILKPFNDRMQAYGVLPIPNKKITTEWPDLNTPTDEDRANIASKRTDALVKYVAGAVSALVQPLDFLTVFLELDLEQAQLVLDHTSEALGLDSGDLLPLPGSQDPNATDETPPAGGKGAKNAAP